MSRGASGPSRPTVRPRPPASRLVAGFVSLALLGASGCCTQIIHRAYPGPELAPDQEAVLLQRDHTFVVRIDDQPVPCQKECCREIRVAPGPHTIWFAYFAGDSWAKGAVAVRFVAEPGATYEVHRAELDGFWLKTLKSFYGGSGKWVGWLVDARTQEVVGGLTPERWRQVRAAQAGGSDGTAPR